MWPLLREHCCQVRKVHTGMLSVWFLQHSAPALFNKRIRKHCINWPFRELLLYFLLPLFRNPSFCKRALSDCSNRLAFSRSWRSQFQIHWFPSTLLVFLFFFGKRTRILQGREWTDFWNLNSALFWSYSNRILFLNHFFLPFLFIPVSSVLLTVAAFRVPQIWHSSPKGKRPLKWYLKLLQQGVAKSTSWIASFRDMADKS